MGGTTANSLIIDNTYYTNENIGALGGNPNSEGVPIYCENVSDEIFINKLNDYVDNIKNKDMQWNQWKLGEEGYPVFE